jgi:hypothetical protein
VAQWYGERAGRAVNNYGATASHGDAREAVMKDKVAQGPAALYRNATAQEIEQISEQIGKQHRPGSAGHRGGSCLHPGHHKR